MVKVCSTLTWRLLRCAGLTSKPLGQQPHSGVVGMGGARRVPPAHWSCVRTGAGWRSTGAHSCLPSRCATAGWVRCCPLGLTRVASCVRRVEAPVHPAAWPGAKGAPPADVRRSARWPIVVGLGRPAHTARAHHPHGRSGARPADRMCSFVEARPGGTRGAGRVGSTTNADHACSSNAAHMLVGGGGR